MTYIGPFYEYFSLKKGLLFFLGKGAYEGTVELGTHPKDLKVKYA